MKELRIIDVSRTKRGMTHSNHYHKYFAGYAEYDIETKTSVNGSVKRSIRRVYVDDYYTVSGKESTWLLVRGMYVLLFLISLAAFIFCSAQRTESMLCGYVAFPCFMATMAYFWYLWVLGFFIFTHKQMTQYEYRHGSERLIKMSLLLGAVIALPALALLIYILLNWGVETGRNIMSLIGFVAAAGIIVFIGLCEKKIPYRRVKNTATAPSNSVIIKWDRQPDELRGNVIE